MNRPDFDLMSKQEQHRFGNYCSEFLKTLASNKRKRITANIINEIEGEKPCRKQAK